MYVLSFLCFATAFPVGALVIVVSSAVRSVFVCLCGKCRKTRVERDRRGDAHEVRWGLAFELFELAVVSIGVLFASLRHERG